MGWGVREAFRIASYRLLGDSGQTISVLEVPSSTEISLEAPYG